MKIVVQRKKIVSHANGVQNDSVSYLKSILMSINEHGWIQDIKLTMSADDVDTLVVEMLPQGDVNPIDLEPKVHQTISLHNDLKLISIEGVKNRIKVPGLKFLHKSSDNAITYSVNPAYALFLASDFSRAVKLTMPKLCEVNIMYEETEKGSGKYDSTGTICVLSHNSPYAGPMNSYNRFAQIIVRNNDLRCKIFNNVVRDIQLTVQPDGRCGLNMAEFADIAPTPHF